MRLYEIVSKCPPLDLNSKYAYFLIGEHFSKTSIVVTDGQDIIAMTSAYVNPQKEDTLFIWQVAVLPEYRGMNLGHKMINEILKRPLLKKIKYLETTITEKNTASKKVFLNLAKNLNCHIKKKEFLSSEDFTGIKDRTFHESELLYKIGPFDPGKLERL